MLSDILRDVASLVAPRLCPVCGKALGDDELVVCTLCEITSPLTYLWQERDNAMTLALRDIMPVETAAALVWYVARTPWSRVVHSFKYKGKWLLAYNLGRWFGRILRSSGNFDDIDVVIPVPLHWARRLWRGYNQSEYLARGIARELGVKADLRSVKRSRYNRAQVSKSHSERWGNMAGVFEVRRPKSLQGKHILLVDDVFTTGATMISLGQALLSSVADCRLSVVTLSSAHRQLG